MSGVKGKCIINTGWVGLGRQVPIIKPTLIGRSRVRLEITITFLITAK